jgi:hypothetical protein
MAELPKHIKLMLLNSNKQGISDFVEYSPTDMHIILYDTFGENSPIKLLQLSDSDFDAVPLFNMIKYLLQIIEREGELRLTAKGFLPTKVVAEIYSKKFITEEIIELGIGKLYKETDSIAINLSRLLAVLSGIVKKVKNKLSLTRKGREILADNQKLLETIFITYTTKFNWSYYDEYQNTPIGQFGLGFTLILLSKYGKEERLDDFYAEKHFKAFPNLLQTVKTVIYKTQIEEAKACYSIRTFDMFLYYFGLINVTKNDKVDFKKNRIIFEKYITKTDLFDKFIKIIPPTG